MNKNQIIAALIVTAWLSYKLGKRNALAGAADKASTAVTVVDSAAWDWLNAVGRM